jgi:hypothetical protein
MADPTNTAIRILYETHEFTDELGVIRLAQWPEGIVLWVGGEIVWRSWRDAAVEFFADERGLVTAKLTASGAKAAAALSRALEVITNDR